MANCEYLQRCAFLREPMPKYTPSTKSMISRYCFSEKSLCARYVSFRELGLVDLPSDLYPHQLGKALRLMQAD